MVFRCVCLRGHRVLVVTDVLVSPSSVGAFGEDFLSGPYCEFGESQSFFSLQKPPKPSSLKVREA